MPNAKLIVATGYFGIEEDKKSSGAANKIILIEADLE